MNGWTGSRAGHESLPGVGIELEVTGKLERGAVTDMSGKLQVLCSVQSRL